MTSPLELLEEYIRGIDQVLENDIDQEELIEIKRIRLQYTISIKAIERILNKAKTRN